MTKITKQISEQIYNFWSEGKLTKAQVAERFETSEDVVKYHIRKRQSQSASSAHIKDIPAEAVIEEPGGGALQKRAREFIKGLLGREGKDEIIEHFAGKLDELTAMLEQLPIAARTEKPIEPKPMKRYISKVEGLLLNTPAVILHKNQRLIANQNTDEIIKAVSEGLLVVEDTLPTIAEELDKTEFEYHKEQVIDCFQRYYNIVAPCTKDHLTRFAAWYRGIENPVLSEDAIRGIAMEVVLKKTGGNGLVLSPEEELERLRAMDKSKMHLYDLRKIDWDAYKKRAVIEKFQEYSGSPMPLEYSENFVQWFNRYDPAVSLEEVRDIMQGFIRKNRQENEEIQKITAKILQQRRDKRINQVNA